MKRHSGLLLVLPISLVSLTWGTVLWLPEAVRAALPWLPSLATMILLISLTVIVVRDVRLSGSRRKFRSMYRQSDQRYRKLLDRAADGFLFLGDDGEIRADNTVRIWLGLSPEDPIPHPAAIIADDVDGRELLDHLHRRDPDIAGLYETALHHTGDHRRDVVISASRIDQPDLRGFVLMIRDMDAGNRSEALSLQVERETRLEEMQAALLFVELTVSEVCVPPLLLEPSLPASAAAGRMRNAGVNAAVITGTGGAEGNPAGILSDQDLRDRILIPGLPAGTPVSAVMSSPMISLPGDTLIFEAFHFMRDRRISQAGVLDETGQLKGLVTIRRLMEIQGSSSFPLFESLKKAESVAVLADLHTRLPGTVSTLVSMKAGGRSIVRLVERAGSIIRQRIIEGALAEMGAPPLAFAFLALGSEGRGEQTLLTDQDNAIVYADPPADNPVVAAEAAGWFRQLGTLICDRLNEAGYPWCRGGIMAKNPDWCVPLETWKEYFRRWIHPDQPAPGSHLLEVSVFFDFRVVWGDAALGESLRRHIRSQTALPGPFLAAMTETVSGYRPPLSRTGHLKVEWTDEEDPVIDIKAAMGSIISCIRTWALGEGIDERGTLERIEALADRGVFDGRRRKELRHAFEYLLFIRFKEQIELLEENSALENYVYIDDLTEVEKTSLENIFATIIGLQTELRYRFTGELR